MSELRLETWRMPAADLGPDNPLPPIGGVQDLHALEAPAGMPEDMRQSLVYGHVANPMPYTMQDAYTRDRRLKDLRVAVLENEFLRATFLLELGGRMWSLVHKPSGRELLYVNPVLQPANLAIRNAWFSGGVEWNIGLIGHCPFTCSPLFAARVEATGPVSGGPGQCLTPVLRLYEWERIRQVSFQIDAYLPSGSPVLFVRVSIANPHDRDIPMYWWSNVAVPETPGTRVVVPADAAYTHAYDGGVRVAPLPESDGTDVTYPTHIQSASDFFYLLPAGGCPWIAALDGEGKGLVQVSTDRLRAARGRKLFVWGMGAGGRNWQTFLSQPGQAYIEIQAGLARTQMEYLRMPARAEWAWLEAYGLLEADPAAVHARCWGRARQAAAEALERLMPAAALEAEFRRGVTWADERPAELFQRGSGWGVLERLRRQASGSPPLCSGRLVFDDASLGEAQAPWLGLLYEGAMPAFDPQEAPQGYMVQAEWRALLEEAVGAGRGANWLAWLHLGAMRLYAGERDGARQAWERSLAHATTPWALRSLALLALQEGRFAESARLYVAAHCLRPSLLPLAVECGRALIQAGCARQWLDLLVELPETLRSVGRVRLLEAQAALAAGELERVERVLAEKPVVADLREGEQSLSDLWLEYHAQRLSMVEGLPVDDGLRARVCRQFPVPVELDFRAAP